MLYKIVDEQEELICVYACETRAKQRVNILEGRHYPCRFYIIEEEDITDGD